MSRPMLSFMFELETGDTLWKFRVQQVNNMGQGELGSDEHKEERGNGILTFKHTQRFKMLPPNL